MLVSGATQRSRRPAPAAPADAGTSLVEVVVAMVLLGLMSAALLAVLLQTQLAGADNRNRIAAAGLAAREISFVRAEFGLAGENGDAMAAQGLVSNAHPLTGGSVGQPLVLDGTSYTVTRTARWATTADGVSSCEAGSAVQYPTLAVEVQVTWPRMGRTQPVGSSALLAASKENGVASSDAYVTVRVSDPAGRPMAGKNVQVAANGVARTGVSGADGCAVVRVSPAAGGTAYTATLLGPDVVDVAGSATPTRAVGIVTPGTVSSGVSFTVAQAGSLTVVLVRSDGGVMTDADVVPGQQVTLQASEGLGSSGQASRAVTGVRTTLGALWPTTYGAWAGATAPSAGYASAVVPAGGTAQVTVVLRTGVLVAAGLPAGTTGVTALPAGTACTAAAGGTTSVTGTGVTLSLLPRSYDLYASGATFTCSPGPAGIAVSEGGTASVTWPVSRLQLTGVPAGGRVWALNAALAALPAPPTTCPAPADGQALDVDAARAGALALPAGTWYVWLAGGPGPGGCLSYPDAVSPVSVGAGTTAVAWTVRPAQVTVTGLVPARTVLTLDAPLATTADGSPSCSAAGWTTTAGVSGSTGWASTGSGTTAAGTLPRPASGTRTWYVYAWDTSGGTCTDAGTLTLGPLTPTTTHPSGTATVVP